MSIKVSCLNCFFKYPHDECKFCNGYSLWEPNLKSKDLQADPDNVLIRIYQCECKSPYEIKSFPKICGKCGRKIKLHNMTADQLKKLRESFDFTQKQMADILGIHPNAFQRMEYGTSPIPKYIEYYGLSLTILNENMLFRQHIENIGVEL